MATAPLKDLPINNLSNEASLLNITDVAAIKIYELLIEEGDPELKLRISITGGGCSGFQYNFSFDAQTAEDILVERFLPERDNHKAAVLIDMISLEYLEGATIDYKNDANGERFVIINPKAKGTCGCGSSFDV